MDKMKAMVLDGLLNLREEERKIPSIGDDEVLVAIKAVGICGSDIHYYEHGKIGRYIVEKPLILGHECSGKVVAVGKNVKRFKVGDKVAIEPGQTCGKCEYCKSGRYNLCPDVRFFATPPIDGALCEYVSVREDYLFKVPDDMSFEVATLAEPLSVGVHASIRANIKPGESVLILGLGPVGLLAILAAQSFGADRIIAVDIEPFRLEAAKKVGATHALNGKDTDLKEKIKNLTANNGPDVTFETAGAKVTTNLAFDVTKRGGRIVLVGLHTENEIPVNINSVVDNEYNVYGIFRYANAYQKAVDILSKNISKASQLITHKFSFEKSKEAFDFTRSNKDKCIKTVIVF